MNDPMLDIALAKNNYDLHNDFYCSGINFSSVKPRFVLTFLPLDVGRNLPKVVLIFENVNIGKIELYSSNVVDSTTINNFYRGRYQVGNELREETPNKEVIFYIEFENANKWELFCTKCYFQLD